jgi:hypothetical protein
MEHVPHWRVLWSVSGFPQLRQRWGGLTRSGSGLEASPPFEMPLFLFGHELQINDLWDDYQEPNCNAVTLQKRLGNHGRF